MNSGTQKLNISPTPCLLYLLLALAMTWPLAAGITRDVPGDLGDSLLSMWILGWVAESVPRVVTGEMSIADVWNANIFHPEPLALAFSEHLFGQAIQILPVYRLTHNLILSYNLLFLSTFVLSGFAMYLLVRDITGDRYAAFVAGLIYAFVPFRIAQVAHIQSLSSQWMPFALLGFRRHITTHRITPLLGGIAALLMQNWSCGYYLIYFAPFVVLFVLHQIWAARRGRDWKVWLAFIVAGLVVAAGTWPFLALYLEAQRVHGFARPTAEILRFSADVYSYLTAPEALRLLGPVLRAWPKSEGELFLGFVAAALALIGLVSTVRLARAGVEVGSLREPFLLFKIIRGSPRVSIRAGATFVIGAIAFALVAGLLGILLTGGFVTSIAGIPVRATNATRILGQLAIAVAALNLLSGEFRTVCVQVIKSPTGLAVISLVLALWLSLGPVLHARGQVIEGLGLYGLLLDHVPGFDSLRVPARYAMIAALFLAVLAGIGAAVLLRPKTVGGSPRAVMVALCAVILIESTFAPLPVNQTWAEGSIIPPRRVEPAASAPAVYRQLAAMPGDLVVAEFPFGDAAWELRYVYYSTVHWKRLLNGYSGGFPQGYKARAARFQRIAQAPEDAWQTLIDSGTTHLVLHEAALPADQLATLRSWLHSHGATEMRRLDSDVLYDLNRAR